MRSYNILAVDDQPSVLESLELLLEDWDGYNLLVADCAEDAIMLARQAKIDLILLDLIMPDVNGSELLTKLHSYCSKIIVISALRNKAAIRELLAMGVQEYVFKPFDVDALTSIISNTLNNPPKPRNYRSHSSRLEHALIGWRYCSD